MDRLEAMPNIGKELSRQLRAVGVETPAALRETGSREAWLRILAMDPSACYNRLGALEGAIRGTRRADLDEDVKKDLLSFYRAHAAGQSLARGRDTHGPRVPELGKSCGAPFMLDEDKTR